MNDNGDKIPYKIDCPECCGKGHNAVVGILPSCGVRTLSIERCDKCHGSGKTEILHLVDEANQELHKSATEASATQPVTIEPQFLPCPFCGKIHKTLEKQYWHYDGNDKPSLTDGQLEVVLDCVTVPPTYISIENWQSRPIEAALQVRIDELEQKIQALDIQYKERGTPFVYIEKAEVAEEAQP